MCIFFHFFKLPDGRALPSIYFEGNVKTLYASEACSSWHHDFSWHFKIYDFPYHYLDAFICEEKLGSLVNDRFELWITLLLRVLCCKNIKYREFNSTIFKKMIVSEVQVPSKTSLTNSCSPIWFFTFHSLWRSYSVRKNECVCTWIRDYQKVTISRKQLGWENFWDPFSTQSSRSKPKLCHKGGASFAASVNSFKGSFLELWWGKMFSTLLKISPVYKISYEVALTR